MEIAIEKKFQGDKVDNNIKLRSIIDQVTLLLYGQKLNACLGHAMSILKKSITEDQITVRVPRTVWDNADHVDVQYTGWHGKSSRIQDYLRNVIRHGTSHGIRIRLVVE